MAGTNLVLKFYLPLEKTTVKEMKSERERMNRWEPQADALLEPRVARRGMLAGEPDVKGENLGDISLLIGNRPGKTRKMHGKDPERQT